MAAERWNAIRPELREKAERVKEEDFQPRERADGASTQKTVKRYEISRKL